MVRNDNHGRIAILPGIVESDCHSPVECTELREDARSVIAVRHEIDLAALHHQEEAVPVLRKDAYGLLRHLGQRRLQEAVPLHFV